MVYNKPLACFDSEFLLFVFIWMGNSVAAHDCTHESLRDEVNVFDMCIMLSRLHPRQVWAS